MCRPLRDGEQPREAGDRALERQEHENKNHSAAQANQSIPSQIAAVLPPASLNV